MDFLSIHPVVLLMIGICVVGAILALAAKIALSRTSTTPTPVTLPDPNPGSARFPCAAGCGKPAAYYCRGDSRHYCADEMLLKDNYLRCKSCIAAGRLA